MFSQDFIVSWKSWLPEGRALPGRPRFQGCKIKTRSRSRAGSLAARGHVAQCPGLRQDAALPPRFRAADGVRAGAGRQQQPPHQERRENHVGFARGIHTRHTCRTRQILQLLYCSHPAKPPDPRRDPWGQEGGLPPGPSQILCKVDDNAPCGPLGLGGPKRQHEGQAPANAGTRYPG